VNRFVTIKFFAVNYHSSTVMIQESSQQFIQTYRCLRHNSFDRCICVHTF